MSHASSIGRICVCFALIFGTSATAKEKMDSRAAYIIVDIGDWEDGLMQGVDMPGAITIARYDAEKQDIRGGDLSPGTALPKKVSPRLTINRNPVVKTKGMRQYLIKVEPDVWVIEAANGTAFSLGSKMFEIKPGEVVDLGVFKPKTDWLQGEKPKAMASGMLGAVFFGSFRPKTPRPNWVEWHKRTAQDLPLPPEFKGGEVREATYVDGVTFGNSLGGLVNRLGGRAARLKALRQETYTAEPEATESTAIELDAVDGPGDTLNNPLPAP